ncbi:MAG: cytochrome c maturation protein CcmE [Halobacteria archaeon]|nr:cytochrome c maturation protein CcmE [Halobacteria archaeon]
MRRRKKLIFGGTGMAVLLLVLTATTMGITTRFVTPTDVSQENLDGERINLEGRVTAMNDSGETLRFEVFDENASVPVVYDGTTPETMGNGRIVVAKGVYEDGRVEAQKLSVRAHEGTDRPESSK